MAEVTKVKDRGTRVPFESALREGRLHFTSECQREDLGTSEGRGEEGRGGEGGGEGGREGRLCSTSEC